MRQGAPLAPRAVQIQECIDHFTHLNRSRTPSWFRGGTERFEDGPLLVSQIAGIALEGELVARLPRARQLLSPFQCRNWV